MTPHFQALLERSIYEHLRLFLVAEGLTPDITQFPEGKQGYEDYKATLASIEQDYGFAVELFNISSNMELGLKKVPRIVLAHNSIIPGSWGSAPDYMKKLKDGAYKLVKIDRVSVELFFSCSIITNTVSQLRVLNSIVTTGLPSISYVPYYVDEASQDMFLVKFESSMPFNDNYSGIMENRFMYSVPDIILHEILSDDFTPAIKNITLNTIISNSLGLTLNI